MIAVLSEAQQCAGRREPGMSHHFQDLAVVAAITLAARAASAQSEPTAINISGLAFHEENFGGPSNNIVYVDQEAVSGGDPVTMVAAIPRIPNTIIEQSVYMDGYLTSPSDKTTCSVLITDYTGQVLGSKSIEATGVTLGYWDKWVIFSVAEAPYWAYMSVRCEVPLLGSMLGVILNS